MKILKKRFKNLLGFILYGNFIIALCATMSVLSTVVLFDSFVDENDIKLALFVGAATFFLYNIHKPITYFLRQQFIDNQRFTRTKQFRGPLSIWSIFAVFYCLYFFFYLKLNSQILLILTAILSLSYVLPILGKGRRLRDLSYLKIFLIALVWSFTTVLLPYLDRNKPLSNIYIWQLFIERACFIFALCLPFDIRDIDWDSQTNVKTIPLSIGAKKSKIVGIFALIIACLMVILLKNATFYSDYLSLKLSVIYAITALILLKTHKNRPDYFFYGLVDGMIILQSLVILI
jgi:4-hydroxybenzoate polyprenyltransferase